jgi:hypothetical protein
LPDLVANNDLEGLILQISHGGFAGLASVKQWGGMVLVDPQTYKLGDANVTLTRSMASLPFVTLWPGEVRDPSRRTSFVEAVLDKQVEMGATDLISPYLYVEDASGPALLNTLEMAEDSRRIVGTSRRVWAGLYVTGSELKRPRRRDQFLNLVTSSSIDHSYLIVDPEQAGNGPISDVELIRGLRQVVRVLESNDIRVMLGYSDPLGLLLMGDGLTAFASGVRASLRRLRMAAQRRKGGGGHQAHKRYYVPQLMNFVRVDTELTPTVAGLAAGGATVCQCRYCRGNLPAVAAAKLHPADADRHFVARLTGDARRLAAMNVADRNQEVRRLVQEASEAYEKLADAGVTLSSDSGADHVQAWQKAF